MKQVLIKTMQIILAFTFIILFILLANPLLERLDFWHRIGLLVTRQQQVSVFTEMLEQRNVNQLEAASLYTELIFPYDFLTYPFPENRSAWGDLRNSVEGNIVTQLWADRDRNIDGLPLNDQKNYTFYSGIRDIWIDMANADPLDYIFRIKVTASAG